MFYDNFPNFLIHYDRINFGSYDTLNVSKLETSNKYEILTKTNRAFEFKKQNTNNIFRADFKSYEPNKRWNHFWKVIRLTHTQKFVRFVALSNRIQFKKSNKQNVKLHDTILSTFHKQNQSISSRIYDIMDLQDFIKIDLELKEAEISIDFQGIEKSKDFLEKHLNIGLIKKSSNFKETKYSGNRKSNVNTRLYNRKYKDEDILRLEIVFRRRKLKQLGLLKPMDLLNFDWTKEISKYISFVNINPQPAAKKFHGILKEAYENGGIAGYKQKVKELKIKKGGLFHILPIQNNLLELIQKFNKAEI